MPEALRHNTGKPQMARLFDFSVALEGIVRVLEQGAIKYEDGNWLRGGKDDEEYLSAAIRHMMKHQSGEFYDAETGCPHLSHAAWNLLALYRLNWQHNEPINPMFDQEAFKAQWAES